MKTRLTYIVTLLLSFLIVKSTFSQLDEKLKANELFQAKKFDEAKVVIDAVVLNNETKEDPEAWTLKAYIYQKLNKQYEQSKLTTNYLDEAVKSTKISMSLDKENAYKEKNIQVLNACWKTYYNLQVKLLQDSLNYEKSNVYFNKYVETRKITESTYNEKNDFIEYYKKVASQFAELYTNSNFNKKYGDIARLACLKILDVDSQNFQANFIMAVTYYNQASTIARQMDYDMNLSKMDAEQEAMKKLYNQSKPLMLKAYELDPNSPKVVEGLMTIYTGLLEFDKAKEFETKLLELKKQN